MKASVWNRIKFLKRAWQKVKALRLIIVALIVLNNDKKLGLSKEVRYDLNLWLFGPTGS